MKNMDQVSGSFIWDAIKDAQNVQKHQINFFYASQVFFDPDRVILEDIDHSIDEKRFFCIGKVGGRVCTVRFTYRMEMIRIIGAGFWRKGKKHYEQNNKKK